MKRRAYKWFPTLAERKAWEAKQAEQIEKLTANMNAPIQKLPEGPKLEEWCSVKSKNFRNNGPKLSEEESWLVGGLCKRSGRKMPRS